MLEQFLSLDRCGVTSNQLAVFEAVVLERRRQESLKHQGRFKYTCEDVEMSEEQKYAVLGEEFGEIGRAILNAQKLSTDFDNDNIGPELIQLIAVASAWLEGRMKRSVEHHQNFVAPHQKPGQ